MSDQRRSSLRKCVTKQTSSSTIPVDKSQKTTNQTVCYKNILRNFVEYFDFSHLRGDVVDLRIQ